MPAPPIIRNELILRGMTLLKGVVGRFNDKQVRKLQHQRTEAEFFLALAMLAIESNPISHALPVVEAEEVDWSIFLCKTPTGWSAELKAMLGVRALGKTRKQAVDELKKQITLQIYNARVERAWWSEP